MREKKATTTLGWNQRSSAFPASPKRERGRGQSAPRFKGCCAEWDQRGASPDGCPLVDSEKNNTSLPLFFHRSASDLKACGFSRPADSTPPPTPPTPNPVSWARLRRGSFNDQFLFLSPSNERVTESDNSPVINKHVRVGPEISLTYA